MEKTAWGLPPSLTRKNDYNTLKRRLKAVEDVIVSHITKDNYSYQDINLEALKRITEAFKDLEDAIEDLYGNKMKKAANKIDSTFNKCLPEYYKLKEACKTDLFFVDVEITTDNHTHEQVYDVLFEDDKKNDYNLVFSAISDEEPTIRSTTLPNKENAKKAIADFAYSFSEAYFNQLTDKLG